MGVSVDVSDLDTSSLRGVYVFSLYIFCLFHRSVIEPALQPVWFDLRSIGGSISISNSHLLPRVCCYRCYHRPSVGAGCHRSFPIGYLSYVRRCMKEQAKTGEITSANTLMLPRV